MTTRSSPLFPPEDQDKVGQSVPDLAKALKSTLDDWNAAHPSAFAAWDRYPSVALVSAITTLVDCLVDLASLSKLDDVTMGQRPVEVGVTVTLLKTLEQKFNQVEETLARTSSLVVWRGRELGMPWRAIGDALGMSGQGAYKRAREFGVEFAEDEVPEE